MPCFVKSAKINNGDAIQVAYVTFSGNNDLTYRLSEGPNAGPGKTTLSSINFNTVVGTHSIDHMGHIMQQESKIPSVLDEATFTFFKDEVLYCKLTLKGFAIDNHHITYSPQGHGENISAQFKEIHMWVQALDDEGKPAGGAVERGFNQQSGTEAQS